MKVLKQQYGIRAVTFADDLFTLDKKMVHQFCDLLLLEGVELMWACNGRANLVDKELLRRMRAVGCVFMGYGIESGSPTILREMNKQVTVEQAKEAIHLTWEAGITPFAYMMIGMPGETQQTFRETVDFSKEIGIVEGFGFVTPLPGTPLYEQAREAGKISDPKGLVEGWKDWGKQCLVNMTTLSNEEIVALKTWGEREAAEHFLRTHRKLLLKKFYFYYRVHGFRALVRQLVAWVGKYLARQRGKVNVFSRVKGMDKLPFKNEDFRVLVIALQGLGNVLLITPLLHTLKVGISNRVKISILVLKKYGDEVLRGNPDVDEIIVVDPSQQWLLSIFRLIRNLRSKKFDLAIVAWPGGIRSAIIAFLCGAKMRIGHRQNTALFKISPFLYTHRLITEKFKHDLERNLEFAQVLGIEAMSTKIVFPLTEEDRAVVQRFLSQSGIDNNLFFGLHPGSGSEMSYKRWPRKRFAEFGNRLVKQYGGAVIIFGGPEEIALMEEVATLMEPKPLLAKNASLKKTAALIERCKVFISNDSGLMHLATAMGVPTVGIFGPTEPDKTAPYGEQNRIVRKEFGCSPCFRFEKRRFRCSTLECLKNITVENVLEAVGDLLSKGNNT
jgi:heptosyltransferase-2